METIIIFANTKQYEGIYESDGSKLGFVGKQGALFGYDSTQTRSCMSFDLDIFTENLNSSDSYQFSNKNDNDFSSAPSTQFGYYLKNTN